MTSFDFFKMDIQDPFKVVKYLGRFEMESAADAMNYCFQNGTAETGLCKFQEAYITDQWGGIEAMMARRGL